MVNSKIEINEDFLWAKNLLNQTISNLFVTGKAGTGKSTFLNYFTAECTKKIVLLAPTGVAALNIKGSTIHSFFRFSPGVTEGEAAKKALICKDPGLFQKIEVMVIDEVSMVRADLLDCIDKFLRIARKVKAPFGGVQMLFIGDLYQLPPIVQPEEKVFFEEVYNGPYFFNAKVFNDRQFKIEYLEFTKIYRQKDSHFINLLNEVRHRQLSPQTLTQINHQVTGDYFINDNGYIYLTTTNFGAKKINQQKMVEINRKSYHFPASIIGEFSFKDYPNEADLTLKVGAQVMFLMNSPQGDWVNGTIGHISHIDFEKEEVRVVIDNNEVIVTPYTWNIFKYIYDTERKILMQESVGSFTQLPIKPAWAITIHKSQGKSFDKVILYLERGAFATGQTYVALSRCRDLKGLRLINPLRPSDIRIDERVVEFSKQFNSGEKLAKREASR